MAYIGNDPSFANLYVNKYTYTATEGQTIFPAVYDNEVDVYFNGQKLQKDVDYTATDGVAVILSEGASAGDVIDIQGYFNFANLITDADTLDGFDSTAFARLTSNTGTLILPSGNTANRVDEIGIRLNDETGDFEGYNGSNWGSIGGGATGGGNDKIFFINNQVVTEDFTIASGENAGSFGPTITIASGVNVTVETGGNWTIV